MAVAANLAEAVKQLGGDVNYVNQMLQDAVRAGKIQRASACSNCGTIGKVEGHHEDYARPLDVVWLCRRCHWHHHLKQHAVFYEGPKLQYEHRMQPRKIGGCGSRVWDKPRPS